MTDRMESCKESPDGKHEWARRRDGYRCAWCEQREYGPTKPHDGSAPTSTPPTHEPQTVADRSDPTHQS